MSKKQTKAKHTANSIRVIQGLQWARWSTGEFFVGGSKKNLTNSQKAGLRFEKKVGIKIGDELGTWAEEIKIGPWIEFKDKYGLGIAQPDQVVVGKKTVLVFENKLTYTDRAWAQLNKLYLPLLREIYPEKKHFVGIQVCKRLTIRVPHYECPHLGDCTELRRGNAFVHLPFI